MFGWIGPLMQAIASNPQLMAGLAIHVPRLVQQLSPETKAKIASVVRWGVEQAARQTLGSVLGEVGNRIVDQVVANQDVAEFAKALVMRGVEVGVDRALKESHITS
ncbi:MAG: hypothetical protein K8U57_28565 [Planctomycetes bacterium]|nr:hypothetical protein [Planctomycetota bacterium]